MCRHASTKEVDGRLRVDTIRSEERVDLYKLETAAPGIKKMFTQGLCSPRELLLVSISALMLCESIAFSPMLSPLSHGQICGGSLGSGGSDRKRGDIQHACSSRWTTDSGETLRAYFASEWLKEFCSKGGCADFNRKGRSTDKGEGGLVACSGRGSKRKTRRMLVAMAKMEGGKGVEGVEAVTW